MRVVSQGKKQRNFNVLAKDKIDEKPLQDFSMANAAKNVSRAKYLWSKGTELTIECEEVVRQWWGYSMGHCYRKQNYLYGCPQKP